MRAPMMNGWPRSRLMTMRQTYWLAVVLGLALCSGSAAIAADSGWRALIHPEHLSRVEDPRARALAVLDHIGAQEYGYDEVKMVRELLAAETMVRPAERLLADWRCRSIQVNRLGIFSYPNFRCRIKRIEGEWDFRKLSGSQKRSGSLYQDQPGRWVFLGGQYVNDDPPRAYSGIDDQAQSDAYDTVGELETLADGRLRMLLDSDEDSFELYVLER